MKVSKKTGRNEGAIKDFLTELLMNVPLTRGMGDDQLRLHAFRRAILFFPTFRDWPSPSEEWIDEAKQLCNVVGDTELATLIGVREAVVQMRTGELDHALRQLETVQQRVPDSNSRLRCYATVTRSRIYIRHQNFDLAREAVETAVAFGVGEDDWVGLLPAIAKGELFLEMNEIDRAEPIFLDVLQKLPLKMIEDRVQVLQCLGFIYITRVDAKKAVRYLDEARRLLKAAGIWSEVVQMNLTVGNFFVSLKRTSRAKRLFEEALALCQSHHLSTWEALLQLGLARAQVSKRDFPQAVAASLKAAMQFARQGNVIAYMSTISFIAGVHIQDRNYQEAYRVLALGTSISKQLGLPIAENVFRTQINTLRNEHLGPERFDEMAKKMIRDAKDSQGTSILTGK